MLIITASHQTISGQFWCLSSQNKFDLTHLLYIINGKDSEDKVMSGQISTLIISTVSATLQDVLRMIILLAVDLYWALNSVYIASHHRFITTDV